MLASLQPWLAAAALLSAATALIHTFLGGREIAVPLLAARDLAPVPKLTAYYCWHMVTLLLFAMAVGFALAAAGRGEGLATGLTILAALFALLSLGLVVGYRVNPWHMPQWALFLPIALCGALGNL
ncbi:hypothetical protein QNA08_07790 [Chelatococcus sp. SYSU_G07232]|uniref:DUF423 domain-containing protein n=1 Tax=Chelatococcus albus TaxID=3047466 RepID=A0ABT7AFK6_9HYPH|nr:hypothetical protein [Chelatococcus sp. SYSU_G07232]MDJ1158131.1 hypothetical protein [Chelatococcus sp. SYSU_G07232]